MPGLPADHVLTIIRIKQWQQDRAALATSRTTDYTRTGWKQRNHRAADARIVRVLDFERAFAMLEQEHQQALALIYRDNQPQDKAADAIGCSQRKLCTCYPKPDRTWPTFSIASTCCDGGSSLSASRR